MKMCQALALNEHTVTLLAPTKHGEYEPNVDNVFDFYDVKPVFRLQKLFCPRIKGRSIIYALAVARAVHHLGPDLVFGRYVHGCALSAWMGYPTLFEVHQPIGDIGRVHHFFFETLRRSSSFRRLVVISEALKEIYVDRKDVGSDRVAVLHDAADDPGTPSPANITVGRKEALQVGYVGNLYPGKGMSVIAKIGPRMPEVNFHIVGGLEEDVANWEGRVSASNVHFHGFVNQVIVPRCIAAMDVCLLPNQRSVKVYGGGEADIGQYTSLLKMFEYMSHGKPIIASDLPVLREVLDDGRNALLCDPENPDEWITAIHRLQTDAELRRSLGAEARRDFEMKYTWSRRAEQILNSAAVSPSKLQTLEFEHDGPSPSV